MVSKIQERKAPTVTPVDQEEERSEPRCDNRCDKPVTKDAVSGPKDLQTLVSL